MKKKTKILLIVIAAVCVCGFASWFALFVDHNIPLFPSEKYEDFGEGFMDFTDYCRYTYKRDVKLNKHFNKVSGLDIHFLRTLIESFPYDFLDEPDNYDFPAEKVSVGDSYFVKDNDYTPNADDGYIMDNTTFYFYDAETRTMYYFHNDN